MSDAVDHGITVTEIANIDQPIDVCPETTAAFVGRALRGPLNTPVLVTNFGEFKRLFGDSWSRSSLGPAVALFFQHGGKRLYIVRVANAARGSLLCVPASGSALVMRTVNPGSTELIRAAIDFDGIDAGDDSLFNLTLQRVDPATSLVVDQEIFRRCDWQEDAERFVANELLSSSLARVEKPFPLHRPEATRTDNLGYDSTYVEHSQAGTDGKELSDYDLIGSRRERSGFFALEKIERFDTLYLPAPAKGVDAGAVAIMAAELYCRERGAMLIVDPPADWLSVDDVVDGQRDLGYRSANLMGYFPRMTMRSDDGLARPIGGALAGLLCKQDQTFGPWQALDQQGLGLARSLKPVVELHDDDIDRLSRLGLNAIAKGPAGRARVLGSVTMGRGGQRDRLFSRLPVHRFCLAITNAVSQATRWAVFEKPDESLAAHVRGQVLTYLECLNDLGAFAREDWQVHCNTAVVETGTTINLELAFTVAGCYESVHLFLQQSASGCRVNNAFL